MLKATKAVYPCPLCHSIELCFAGEWDDPDSFRVMCDDNIDDHPTADEIGSAATKAIEEAGGVADFDGVDDYKNVLTSLCGPFSDSPDGAIEYWNAMVLALREKLKNFATPRK